MAFFATQPPQQLPEPGYGQGLEWREANKWYRVNLIGTRVGPTPYGTGSEPTNSLPGSGTGNVGDFYMHTPQAGFSHLYGPKQANGTWPLIGRVDGSPETGPHVGIPEGYTDGGLYTTNPNRPTSTNPTYPYVTQIETDGLGNFWGLVLWQYNTVEGWYAANPVQTGASPADAVVADTQTGQALVWDGTKWVNALVDSADTTYDNATSGLTATDVQAAIDELVTALDGQNDASEISYDNNSSGLTATDVQAAVDEVALNRVSVVPSTNLLTFNIIADYGSNVSAACFVDAGAPDNGNGSDDDWYYRTDGGAGTTYYRKVSGAWVAVDEATIHVQSGGLFDQGDAENAANGDLNLDYIVVLGANPPTVDADFIEADEIVRQTGVYADGQAIVWDAGGNEWTQAPIPAAPYPAGWQSAFWVSFFWGSGAPSGSTPFVPGAHYLDTDTDELYGPAFFDPGIPGVEWGTGTVVTVSVDPPDSGDTDPLYVQDDTGGSGNYILWSLKDTINGGELALLDPSGIVQGHERKVSADDVFVNLSFISTATTVTRVSSEIYNLYTSNQYGYLGGRDYFLETNIDGTYEVNPYDGNGFVLTLTDDTTISISSSLNSLSGFNLGTRWAEITIVLRQDSTGGWVTTWDSNIKVSSGVSLTTTADAVDMLKAVSWDDGATWYLTQIGADFA